VNLSTIGANYIMSATNRSSGYISLLINCKNKHFPDKTYISQIAKNELAHTSKLF